jgi:hypothetical protein
MSCNQNTVYPSITCGQSEEFDEYYRLSSLYCDLPPDLFVSRLILDYASDEQKLDHTRSMQYDIVRECEDFPHGGDAEIKRRVFTHKGDPISVKLANDIYVILSVLEGDDFSFMKDIVSTSRGRTKSQSVNDKSENIPCHGYSNSNQRVCQRDFPSIRNAISGLQAEVLMLKQERIADEKLRSDQINHPSDIVY